MDLFGRQASGVFLRVRVSRTKSTHQERGDEQLLRPWIEKEREVYSNMAVKQSRLTAIGITGGERNQWFAQLAGGGADSRIPR